MDETRIKLVVEDSDTADRPEPTEAPPEGMNWKMAYWMKKAKDGAMEKYIHTVEYVAVPE